MKLVVLLNYAFEKPDVSLLKALFLKKLGLPRFCYVAQNVQRISSLQILSFQLHFDGRNEICIYRDAEFEYTDKSSKFTSFEIFE